MNNKFKRALSSVLAFAMVLSCLTVVNVSSVFAATGDFSFDGQIFYDSTDTSAVKPAHTSVEKEGLYTATVTDSNFTFSDIGTFATSKGKTLTNETGFSYEMLAAGAREIDVTPEYPGTATVYVYHDGTKTLSLNGTAVETAATKWVVTGYEVSCSAGETLKIGLATNIAFVGLDYVAGEVTTYNWTLDKTGLDVVNGDGLTLGSNTSTKLSNTLSYTGSDYKLKDEYATVTESTDGVTVDGTDVVVKPTDDWFEAVAPKTYVSVEPTVNGSEKVYDFRQTDDTEVYLIDSTDSSKSATTAYNNHTDDNCYVTLSKDGAKLYDDSTTNSAQLYIPYSAKTGKVTISGTVTPTNGTGTKWKLVDFGCIAVAADSSKNIALTTNSAQASATNAGAIAKGQAVTYSVTFDLDNKKASGTITNGTTTTEYTDIEISDTITKILFVTNSSGCVTSGDDRALLIPSVTIKEESAAATSKFDFYKTITGDSGTVYVIGKIAEGDVTDDVDEVGFGIDTDSEKAAKYEDLTSGTVYESLIVNNETITAETGYYLMGFKITDVDQDFYASAYSKTDGTATHVETAAEVTTAAQ